MTGTKLSNKQSERIVKMNSKHEVTYISAYIHQIEASTFAEVHSLQNLH